MTGFGTPRPETYHNDEQALIKRIDSTDDYLLGFPKVLDLSIRARSDVFIFPVEILLKFLQCLMGPVNIPQRPPKIAALVV